MTIATAALPRHDVVAQVLARNRLGVGHIVTFVMAAAPLTVVGSTVGRREVAAPDKRSSLRAGHVVSG